MNIDKAHLRDKRAAFRIDGIPGAFVETVALVENDGIWFHGGDLFKEVAKGANWADMKKPVIFVPFSQLNWLVTSDELA